MLFRSIAQRALDIVRALRDERVTLTSIAVGQGSHVPFIRDMAAVGVPFINISTLSLRRAVRLPNALRLSEV